MMGTWRMKGHESNAMGEYWEWDEDIVLLFYIFDITWKLFDNHYKSVFAALCATSFTKKK